MGPTTETESEPAANGAAGFRRFAGAELVSEEAKPEEIRISAAQRDERGEELVAGLAHDFNNLLSVILGCASELEQGLEREEDRERAADIVAAAERGARLTKQFVGRSVAAAPPAQPVDVNEEIQRAERLLARTTGPQLRIRYSLAPGLPRVLLAAGQLEQVLVNLAANARDAMPRGGMLAITTAMENVARGTGRLGPGWHVRLSVADQGDGMEPDVLARAFDPFFSTKRSGDRGMGLSSVLAIAREAGGDVHIDTLPRRGTKVSVLLPGVRGNGDPLAILRRGLGDR